MSSQTFPLASNQKDIWFDQLAYPDTAVYNIGGYLIIYGDVNFALLESSIKQLVSESDAFRLVSESDAFRLLFKLKGRKKGRQAVQFIDDDIKGKLTFIDYSDSADSKELTKEYLHRQFSTAFDVNSLKPLWQFVLVKEQSDKYYLLTKYHHLIADGWTTKIVIERLAELYNGLLNSDQSVLDKQPVSYQDFISQEKIYLKSRKFQQDKEV